jgi:hypothetical protein
MSRVAASAATCMGSRPPAWMTHVPSFSVWVTAAAQPSAGQGEARNRVWPIVQFAGSVGLRLPG